MDGYLYILHGLKGLKYYKSPLMGILVTFTIKGLDCNEYTF